MVSKYVDKKSGGGGGGEGIKRHLLFYILSLTVLAATFQCLWLSVVTFNDMKPPPKAVS